MPKDCDTCNTIAENIAKSLAEGRQDAAQMQFKILLGHLANTCLKAGVAVVVVWKAVEWIMIVPK
jgi:hypothetical protein